MDPVDSVSKVVKIDFTHFRAVEVCAGQAARSRVWGVTGWDRVYAETPKEIAARQKSFLHPLSWFASKPLPGNEWRQKCKSVADSLEEAGDKLFTFARLRLIPHDGIVTRHFHNRCPRLAPEAASGSAPGSVHTIACLQSIFSIGYEKAEITLQGT